MPKLDRRPWRGRAGAVGEVRWIDMHRFPARGDADRPESEHLVVDVATSSTRPFVSGTWTRELNSGKRLGSAVISGARFGGTRISHRSRRQPTILTVLRIGSGSESIAWINHLSPRAWASRFSSPPTGRGQEGCRIRHPPRSAPPCRRPCGSWPPRKCPPQCDEIGSFPYPRSA